MNQDQYDKLLMDSQLQGQSYINSGQAVQQQLAYQELEKGIAEEQLEVDSIIYSLFNILSGKELTFDGTGRREWTTKSNTTLRVLSDNGIQRTMQTIIAYVNKLKMLSNHSNEEILKAMYDFTTELNDNILMRYEDIFYTPTFQECKDILDARIKEKVEIKQYSYAILGKNIDESTAKNEVLKEMETRVEYELKKIRDEERKKRIKEYGMLLLIIEHQVLDTYRRSEGGKERETLRRHSNFSEIRAVGVEKNDGGMFGWLKKK